MSFLRELSILDLSSLFQTPFLENSNLTMLLQNLTLLEELYIDGVNLTIRGNEWGQALSSSLSNLRVLSMESYSFSSPIDESLCKLQSLSMIKLDSNNLSSPVPKCFMNFSNLTSLSLTDCALNGTFPKEIFQIPTLKILDISENDLLDGSFPEFPQNSNIQTLETSSTNFRGTIPASIGNLQQLSTLELSVCHYSGTLPKSMTNLTQLVFLRLFGNNFTGSIPSFHMPKNLTEIHLSFNRFTGPLPSAAYWQGLLNLVYVDLTNNTITGSIPSSLFSLPSVQWIDLSYNQFSGRLLEFQIPPSSVLASVDLRGNELEGLIPKSFFKLKNLGDLLLSFNKFNGTFQLDRFNTSGNNSNFSSLTLFTSVKLASCNLRTFPEMLRNQLVLSLLDLSNNQISGKIPNWIWKVGNGSLFFLNLSRNHLVGMHKLYPLPNLQTIDLSFNQLHGKIPVPSNDYHVDFSSNCFTASIPLDIGNYLSNVRSNNGLTRIIPESICNTSSLKALDLSNNSLSGQIPTCMFALSGPTRLNLARNNLSGPIPDAFPVNCSLETLMETY
ncbi:leucine-rich repeat receptor-like serine/threonine-protein kinase SKM1 [Ziziphus jujuba]|uniref:Leucine-rich repeat receptor-like serine/threonine-protein kinase SKM1 n=1 Tax=Ziziphus jujuba TaxID=326968 RepID=A0A6P4AAC7_ZIZJJ|nr:leucine-rich repeat receptor-like serine/threonine-protein kinase SKM1 [Ziziphus jujuba]